ncbi:MAG TPA: hypothetical protein VM557_02830 [Thermoanaerobaculia bacterium]|nr:hypothetical protein [Thermoanaerobaculia bacterium]
MRQVAVAFLAGLVTLTAHAQSEPPRRYAAQGTGQLIVLLNEIKGEARLLSASMNRDAFIVSQMVAAVGDLENFQSSAALEKALLRIEEAQKRARQNPVAPPAVADALSGAEQLLRKARDSGFGDLSGTQKELLRFSSRVQRVLYVEMEQTRALRRTLAEAQSSLIVVTMDMDHAMGEALSATFDFFRKGGN